MLNDEVFVQNAVVAGNGSSLKEIDYLRIPHEFDLFRTNQFWFEECYYLGKDVKGAVFQTPVAALQKFYTLKILNFKKEYHINMMYLGAPWNMPQKTS